MNLVNFSLRNWQLFLLFLFQHTMTQCKFHAYTHLNTHTYHKDEGAKTLCQGLTKQHVTDLEEPGQFVQIHLLSAHVFLLVADGTVKRQAQWVDRFC